MDTIRRRFPIAFLAAAASLAGTQIADAQVINRCRIDGRLVIQSSPCPLEPSANATATAAPSGSAAATNASKKKTLADLLRERDGDVRKPSPTREAQGDGANILRPRMGAF